MDVERAEAFADDVHVLFDKHGLSLFEGVSLLLTVVVGVHFRAGGTREQFLSFVDKVWNEVIS